MEGRYDYIIVGQGLAGTFLAHRLLKRNRKVLVVDEHPAGSSSLVAAGIFNPVTGRRFAKTWMAETLFPYAEESYRELEELLGERFYFRKDILRPFSSVKEQNDWLLKEPNGSEAFATEAPPALFAEIENDFGGLLLNPGGFVDVKMLMGLYRSYLQRMDILVSSAFEVSEMHIQTNQVIYKGIEAKRIIFCEGYKGTVNPYFSWLPLSPAKGEILTVKIPGCSIDKIISKGIFILPLGNEMYRVGATYSWHEFNETPTAPARKELTEKLEKLLKVPFEIVHHEAGVRPAVKDRRPLTGLHPEHPALGIFNGLGTKGVLLAPYFANDLAEHLESGTPLNEEASIERFRNLL